MRQSIFCVTLYDPWAAFGALGSTPLAKCPLCTNGSIGFLVCGFLQSQTVIDAPSSSIQWLQWALALAHWPFLSPIPNLESTDGRSIKESKEHKPPSKFDPLSKKYFFPGQTLTLTVPSSIDKPSSWGPGGWQSVKDQTCSKALQLFADVIFLAGGFFCEKSYLLWQFESQSLFCNFQSSLVQTLGVAATESWGLWLSNE